MRQDTAQGLMLWWNISTCRHLGVGGTHPDAAIRASQKKWLGDYRRLKRYFCNGAFYGIDEITHVHVHPDGKSAVINCFNLENSNVEREFRFDPAKYGLPAGARTFTGAESSTAADNVYAVKVSIPPTGHTLIEVA